MAIKVKQKHGGALLKPAKGETMNPNGRPKKYVSLLKKQGYKLSEINDSIQNMMAMTIDELQNVYKNADATVLEKTIASAIRKSIEKGSLDSIDTLLTRLYGKPKETVDQTVKVAKPIIIDWSENDTTNP